MEQTDYLPLSMLNQLEYCERRFYLMHVQGEMEINAPVLDGTLQHERTHRPGTSTEGETVTHRRVYVWSDRLQISGFADVVEERRDEGGAVVLCPVEYKRGKMGKWLNDHVQLCAQALCLEELATRQPAAGHQSFAQAPVAGAPTCNLQPVTCNSIPKGYLFYFGSRRREEVIFTPELRAHTEAAVQRAFELVAAGSLPSPIDKRAKCRDCSLQPVCLPSETDVWTGRATPKQR
ncbi:MAG: CRISPR-associated protein Cas4 [Thermoflexales bacterium]|nr:CRISPR-associated protein Cas4 [Thermoflexales bacterium]